MRLVSRRIAGIGDDHETARPGPGDDQVIENARLLVEEKVI